MFDGQIKDNLSNNNNLKSFAYEGYIGIFGLENKLKTHICDVVY